MAVTVEWTNQGCALHKTQVTSSLTISTLAHHLKYKQHLIAWEIGYFTKKKSILLSLFTLHLGARLVEHCRNSAVMQRGKSHPGRIEFSAGLRQKGRWSEILWTNLVNAGFKCCWETLDLFLAQPFFISGVSGQSPKTGMFRHFSIKSVHSPFLV